MKQQGSIHFMCNNVEYSLYWDGHMIQIAEQDGDLWEPIFTKYFEEDAVL